VDDQTTGGQIPKEHTNLAPKWLLNGFPKAGLHFLELMMQPLARRMPPGQMHARPFVGTFAGRSWTNEWVNVELFMYQTARLLPGHYFYSHIGHQAPIEAFLYYLGTAHVFVVRDFRDVAVSQAYHALSENDDLAHPNKELYQALGGFDEVLTACIGGITADDGIEYPGVMGRWQYYADWTEADWTYLFRFEDALAEPERVAGEIITYGVGRAASIFGYDLRAEGPSFGLMVEQMVESAAQRDKSITFRKGVAGGWREAFTEQHKRLFKETDKDGWLVRLGYEDGPDW